MLFFAMTAAASDFRALDIGQLCSNSVISGWETSHGSSETESHLPILESYSYNAEQFNQSVWVIYICMYGRLLTGNYFFNSEPWSKTIDSYRLTYEALRAEYGDPTTEDLPWTGKEDRDPPPRAHPRGYMTGWRTSRFFVRMNVGPNEKWEPAGWRLVVTVSKTEK